MYGRKAYIFHKDDGSNIRVEWNHKKGFFKFGTRTQLLSPEHPIFGQAIPAFQEQLADDLEKAMQGIKRYVAFFEFYGENSFAGVHTVEDSKIVRLFDVNVHPKGFLPPEDYLEVASKVDSKVPYIETCTFDQDVVDFYKFAYDQSTEGVVVKGLHQKGQIWRTKVKTQGWVTKLQTLKGEDWKRHY